MKKLAKITSIAALVAATSTAAVAGNLTAAGVESEPAVTEVEAVGSLGGSALPIIGLVILAAAAASGGGSSSGH